MTDDDLPAPKRTFRELRGSLPNLRAGSPSPPTPGAWCASPEDEERVHFFPRMHDGFALRLMSVCGRKFRSRTRVSACTDWPEERKRARAWTCCPDCSAVTKAAP